MPGGSSRAPLRGELRGNASRMKRPGHGCLKSRTFRCCKPKLVIASKVHVQDVQLLTSRRQASRARRGTAQLLETRAIPSLSFSHVVVVVVISPVRQQPHRRQRGSPGRVDQSEGSKVERARRVTSFRALDTTSRKVPCLPPSEPPDPSRGLSSGLQRITCHSLTRAMCTTKVYERVPWPCCLILGHHLLYFLHCENQDMNNATAKWYGAMFGGRYRPQICKVDLRFFAFAYQTLYQSS